MNGRVRQSRVLRKPRVSRGINARATCAPGLAEKPSQQTERDSAVGREVLAIVPRRFPNSARGVTSARTLTTRGRETHSSPLLICRDNSQGAELVLDETSQHSSVGHGFDGADVTNPRKSLVANASRNAGLGRGAREFLLEIEQARQEYKAACAVAKKPEEPQYADGSLVSFVLDKLNGDSKGVGCCRGAKFLTPEARSRARSVAPARAPAALLKAASSAQRDLYVTNFRWSRFGLTCWLRGLSPQPVRALCRFAVYLRVSRDSRGRRSRSSLEVGVEHVIVHNGGGA